VCAGTPVHDEQTVWSVNVIAWMAPVPPFRLAGRASFLYKTNLELGSEQACIYQLMLSARGLAQLIARCSLIMVIYYQEDTASIPTDRLVCPL